MGLKMSKKNRCMNENKKNCFQKYKKYEDRFRPIKIGLLGDEKVGKTSILNSFLDFEFQDNYLQTIGNEKFEKKVNLESAREIKLVIFDVSGQKRFRSAALRAVRNAEGILLVFDITDKNSFDNIEKWLEEIKDEFEKEPIIILFGNKVDEDKEKWKISIEEIEGVAKNIIGIIF